MLQGMGTHIPRVKTLILFSNHCKNIKRWQLFFIQYEEKHPQAFQAHTWALNKHGQNMNSLIATRVFQENAHFIFLKKVFFKHSYSH